MQRSYVYSYDEPELKSIGIESIQYDAWGNVLGFDVDERLIYQSARHFDPTVGRRLDGGSTGHQGSTDNLYPYPKQDDTK